MILYIQMKNILNYIYILSLYMLKLELPGRTNITRKTCYKKFEDNENQGVKKWRRSGLHLTLSGCRQKSFTFGWKMSKLNFERGLKAPIYFRGQQGHQQGHQCIIKAIGYSRGTGTNPRIYTGAHRLARARRYLWTARRDSFGSGSGSAWFSALIWVAGSGSALKKTLGRGTIPIHDNTVTTLLYFSRQGPQYQYVT